MGIPGFDEFELDIERAFEKFLPPFLDDVQAALLTPENIDRIPAKKNGVYLLIKDNKVKYVGKTDAKKGFSVRLSRHHFHLQHRKHFDYNTIFFKAVAIPVFKNADIEDMLIRIYKADWNNSGFGSNDPGKNRDGQITSKFDTQYPIDTDIPLDMVKAGITKCGDLLKELSASLPYTFRYEKKKNKTDLETAISIPRDNPTMAETLQFIVDSLPHKVWQATILHGRVILYPEAKNYDHFQSIIRPHLPE